MNANVPLHIWNILFKLSVILEPKIEIMYKTVFNFLVVNIQKLKTRHILHIFEILHFRISIKLKNNSFACHLTFYIWWCEKIWLSDCKQLKLHQKFLCRHCCFARHFFVFVCDWLNVVEYLFSKTFLCNYLLFCSSLKMESSENKSKKYNNPSVLVFF